MNIKKVLKDYGITSIWHFTDFSNLKSIEKYGILSLHNIMEKDINVSHFGADALSHNLDMHYGLDKYVHLSFIKDHPMYHVALRRGSIMDPVWIELDISILFEETTMFSDAVANESNSNIFKLNEVNDMIDFATMIYERDFWARVNSRKAEIMVANKIDTNKILGVS